MTDWEKQNYISLAKAAEGTPYSQEYLSLLVRKGKIDAKKFGRNWYVTQASVGDYLQRQQKAALKKVNFLKDPETMGRDIGLKHAIITTTHPLSHSISDATLSAQKHKDYGDLKIDRYFATAFVQWVRHASAEGILIGGILAASFAIGAVGMNVAQEIVAQGAGRALELAQNADLHNGVASLDAGLFSEAKEAVIAGWQKSRDDFSGLAALAEQRIDFRDRIIGFLTPLQIVSSRIVRTIADFFPSYQASAPTKTRETAKNNISIPPLIPTPLLTGAIPVSSPSNRTTQITQVRQITETREVLVPADFALVKSDILTSVNQFNADIRAYVNRQISSLSSSVSSASSQAASGIQMVSVSQDISNLISPTIQKGFTLASGDFAITKGSINITEGNVTANTISARNNLAADGDLSIGGGDLAFGSVATTTIVSNKVNAFSIATSTAAIPFMTFDTSNYRVGIGTTTPGATFSVAGNLLASGQLNILGSQIITTDFTVNGNTTLGDAIGDTITFNSGALSYVNTSTSTIANNSVNAWSIATSTSAIPLLTIDTTSGGRLGIGTTTPWGLFSIEQTGIEPVFVVSDYGTTTPHFFVDGTGNIGIATSSPSQILAVSGNTYLTGGLGVGRATTTSGNFEITGSALFGDSQTDIVGFNSGLLTFTNTATATLPVAVNAFSYATSTSAIPFLTIDTTNYRVGIGTTSPSFTFAAVGTGYLTHGLRIGGAGITNAGITFAGSGNHDITAESGTLRIGSNTIIGNIEALDDTVDIGTAGTRFDKIYANEVNAATLVGTLSAGNLTAETFTINSDNATADTESSNIAYERGTLTPNALITWDSASDEFDFNSGINLTGTIASANGIIFTTFTTDITTGTNEHFVITPNGTGNVGIGTTNPIQALHVVGQCVTGDTLLRVRRRRKGGRYKSETAGPDDEGYDFLTIPITDVKPEDEVLSLDTDTGKFEYRRVKGLIDTGENEVFELQTASGRFIETTANHPYLVRTRRERATGAGKAVAFIDYANIKSWLTDKKLRIDLDVLHNALTASGVADTRFYYGSDEQGKNISFFNALRRMGYAVITKPVQYFAVRLLDLLQRPRNRRWLEAFPAEMRVALLDEAGKLDARGIGLLEPKANFDVEITADALEATEAYDTILLFSGDGDFADLARRIRVKGKRVIVVSGKKSLSSVLRQASDYAVCMEWLVWAVEGLMAPISERKDACKKPYPAVRRGRENGISSIAGLLGLSSGGVDNQEVCRPHAMGGGYDLRWTPVSALSAGQEIAVMTSGVMPHDGGKSVGIEHELLFERIVSLKPAGRKQTYDIEVDDTHNFVAGHLLNRKTGTSLSREEEKKILAEYGNDVVALEFNNWFVPGQVVEDRDNDIIFGGIVAHNTYISSDLSIGGNDINLGTGTATSTLSGGFGIGVGTTTPGAAFAVATSTAGVNTAFLLSNLGTGYTLWAEDSANDTTPFVIDNAGNVGIGTITPIQALHIVGQCVTGDTLLKRRRRRKKADGTYEDVFDDVRIDEIKAGDEILTLDENTGTLVVSRVNALMDMGVKSIIELVTEMGNHIRTTGNHPYFARSVSDRPVKHVSPVRDAGWVSAKHLKVGDHIAVRKPRIGVFVDDANIYHARKKAGWTIDYGKIKQALSGSFAVQFINYYAALPATSDTNKSGSENYFSKIRDTVSLRLKDLKYIMVDGRRVPKGDVDVDLSLDVARRLDDLDVVLVMSGDSDYAALREYVLEKNKKIAFLGFDKTMAWELRTGKYVLLESVREEVARSAGQKTTPEKNLGRLLLSLVYSHGKKLSSPAVENSDTDYLWVPIRSLEQKHAEQVYDIEVEGTHNFIGNDIVAHNTYISSDLSIGGNDINLGTGTATSTLSGGFGIGVGTTTPGAAFAVATSTAGVNTAFLLSNLGTGYTLWAEDSANDASPFVIDNTGNVGIATTTPGSLFSMQGVGNFVSAATSTLYTGFHAPGFLATTSGITISGGSLFQTNTATNTLSGGLSLRDLRITTDGITIAGGSLVNTVNATSTFTGGIIAGGGGLLSSNGISLTGGSFTNTSSATSTWTSAGLSVAGGGLASANGLTITGGAISTNSGALTIQPGANGNILLNPSSTGNIGIGTISPLQALHIVGQCVTGDTRLRRVRRRKGKNGEWIEEWEEVEIKDIQAGDEILTLDENTGTLVVSRVNALMDMGRKPIYKLTTASGKTIRTTAEHPYLIAPDNAIQQKRIAVFIDAANLEKSIQKLGWRVHHKRLKHLISSLGQIVYLGYFTVTPHTESQKQFLASLSRFGYRVYTKILKIIKTQKGDLPKADVDAEIITEMMERQHDYDVILLFSGDSDYRYPLHTLQAKGKKVIVVSTRYSISKELLGVADRYVDIAKIRTFVEKGQTKSPSFATGGKSNLATALSSIEQVSAYVKGGLWKKVSEISEGQMIATRGANSEPIFERIMKIEHLPSEQVYDIEVEGTHNFIGNDIVAHNTYISSDLSIGGNDINLGTGTATTTISGGFGIGVGTTTPGAAFAVATSTAGLNTAMLLSNLGSGYTFWAQDEANDTSPFVIQADGNVGIGTTGPGAKLQVVGVVSAYDSGISADLAYSGILKLTRPALSGQHINMVRSANVAWSIGTVYNSNSFGIGESVVTDSDFTIPDLVITQSGNVGIGTTSPGSLLSVSGSSGLGVTNTGSGSSFYVEDVANDATPFLIDSAGNVGIGTTSPGSGFTPSFGKNLALSGNDSALWLSSTNAAGGTFAIASTFGANAYLGFFNSDSATARMAINSSGNVGIGTTSPAALFSVAGVGYFTGNVGIGSGAPSAPSNTLQIGSVGATAFSGNELAIGDGTRAFALDVTSSVVNLYSSSGIDLAFLPGTTERMRITSTGNVGIGTTDPKFLLHINTNIGAGGDLTLSGNDINLGTGTATTTLSGGFGIGVGTTTPGAAFAVATSTAGVNTAFLLSNLGTGYTMWAEDSANDASPFVIDNAGNVGIGTTVPLKKLDVQSAEDWPLKITGQVGGTGATGGVFIGSRAANKGTIQGHDDTNPADLLLQTEGGNVGIGTTSPAQKLHVYGATYGTIKSDGATGGLFMLSKANVDKWQIYGNNDDLVFYDDTANVDVVTIKQGGNVGIGTTSPSQVLAVNGTGYFQGASPVRLHRVGVGTVDLGVDNITGTADFSIQPQTANSGIAFRYNTSGGVITTGMVLNSSGNVGIGTTSPGSLLSVSGSSGFGLVNTGTGNTFYAYDEASDASPFVIDNAGNVGIGTTGPSDKLHVSGSGNTAIFVTRTGATANTGYIQAASGQTNIGNLAGDISFQPGDANTVTFKSGGNVGIGTTSPGSLLSVSGSSGFGLVNTGTGNTFYAYDEASDASPFVIDNAGNVGIGTTGPAGTLEIAGSEAVASQLILTSTRGIGSLGAFGPDFIFKAVNGIVGGTTYANVAHIIGSKENTTEDDSKGYLALRTNNGTALTEAVRINSSGNVGIGTTGPSDKLHVSGSGNTAIFVTRTGATANTGYIQAASGQTNIGNLAGDISFQPGDANTVTFKSGGNVGIGTTSPGSLLSVSGSSGFGLVNTGTGNTFYAYDEASDATPFVIDNAGNVGIGTTSPSAKLTVDGTIIGEDKLTLNSANTPTLTQSSNKINLTGAGTSLDGIYMANTTGTFFIGMEGSAGNQIGSVTAYASVLGTVGATPLTFSTNNGEDMRIDTSGNVGIGTTSPATTLSVQGNVLISGNLNSVANITATGTMALPNTTSSSIGVVTFGGNRFMHNFTLSGTDGFSTFLGVNAGNFTMTGSTGSQGSYNTAIGNSTLSVNTTGSFNTALGKGALVANTTGTDNTSLGYRTLELNTTGVNNTAVGSLSLVKNVSSNDNTAIGYSSLNNVTGPQNSGLGAYSGADITSGDANTTVGYNTGRGITTGAGNTVLGASVTGLAAGLTNNIILASGGTARGQFDGTNWNFTGNVGIGTTSPMAVLSTWGGNIAFDSNSGVGNVTRSLGIGGVQNSSVAAYARLDFINNDTDHNGRYTGARIDSFNDGTINDGNLQFYTADNASLTEKMRITESGNVGIGTTSPFGILAVEQGGATQATGLTLATTDNDYRTAFMDTTGVLNFTGGDAPTFNTATLNAAGVWTDAPSFSFLKEQRAVLTRDEVLTVLASTTIERFKLKAEVAQYGSAADLQLGIILDEAHPWLSTHDQNGNIIGYSPMRTASVAFRGVQMLMGIFDIRNASTTVPALAIDANGNIGIGTTSPDYMLRVEGDIAARSFVNISTRSVKTDIVRVDALGEDALLDALLSATTTRYKYTGDAGGEEHLGLIAEDAPIAIQSANGKGIDLYKMATALLAGMKAQERKIQELDRILIEAKPPAGGLASITPLNAWVVDQQSGKVNVSFYGDINMQGNALLDVGKITGYLGKWSMDEDGTLMAVKVITDELIAQKVTVGSAFQPSGITLYDEITKEPYCVKMRNGAIVSDSGVCGAATNVQGSISNFQSIINDSIINETASTTAIISDATATSMSITTNSEIVASTTPTTSEPTATTTISLAQ